MALSGKCTEYLLIPHFSILPSTSKGILLSLESHAKTVVLDK